MKQRNASYVFSLQLPPQELAAYERRNTDDNSKIEALRPDDRFQFDRDKIIELHKWKAGGRWTSKFAGNLSPDLEDAFDLAERAKTVRAAIAVMTGLTGVNIPVASAFLSAIDPRRYTIIDFRALCALGMPRNTTVTLNLYIDYRNHCAGLAKNVGMTLRQLDRALWQWHKDFEVNKPASSA